MTQRLMLFALTLVIACASNPPIDHNVDDLSDARCLTIPNSLVGIWVSEDSTLKGRVLVEGVAVYLRSDGLGGIVVGPPALGYQIYASYAPAGFVEYEMVEYGQAVGTGQLVVDPAYETLTLESRVLRRQYSELEDSTLLALGITQSDVSRCGRE